MDLNLSEAPMQSSYNSSLASNLFVPLHTNFQNNLNHSSSSSQMLTSQTIPNQNNPDQRQLFQDQGLLSAEGLTYPVYDKNTNYHQLFWNIYSDNEKLISQMKENVTKAKELHAKINRLKIQHNESEIEAAKIRRENIKKKRRAANEIEKRHVCPYKDCNRSYGSDVSLNLHIKLKHNGGNKTEREKLAKIIIEAKINNKELPEISLNLPPKFLENINLDKIFKSRDKDGNQISGDDTTRGEEDNYATRMASYDNINFSDILNELNKAIDVDRIKGQHSEAGSPHNSNEFSGETHKKIKTSHTKSKKVAHNDSGTNEGK